MAEKSHYSIIPKVAGIGLVLALLVVGIIFGMRALTADEGWDYTIANDDVAHITVQNAVISDDGLPMFTIVFHNMSKDRTVDFRVKDNTIVADDVEYGAFTYGGPYGPDGTEGSAKYSAILFNTTEELDIAGMKTISFDIEVFDADTDEVLATYEFRKPKKS